MVFRSSLPNDKRYFPMLLVERGEGSAAQLVEMWNKYKTLPQNVQDILGSDEISMELKSLQDTFHLDIENLGKITILVRKVFFGEIQMGELGAKVGSILSTTGMDPNQARAIVEFIQKEILTIQPKPKEAEASEEEKREEAALVSLPLLQALSKYEQLGNQLITTERIKVKSQTEPVRPSLLYWLKYYRDELGVGHHDSVQRGQFLFRSENGKKLFPEERERVNLILKSVEENMPLQIDVENSEIIFPHFEAPVERPAQVNSPSLAFEAAEPREQITLEKPTFHIGRGLHFGNAEPKTPTENGTLSFSSTHVFPAEKEKTEVPKAPIPKAPAPKPNPFHIRPASLMKKDEEREG